MRFESSASELPGLENVFRQYQQRTSNSASSRGQLRGKSIFGKSSCSIFYFYFARDLLATTLCVKCDLKPQPRLHFFRQATATTSSASIPWRSHGQTSPPPFSGRSHHPGTDTASRLLATPSISSAAFSAALQVVVTLVLRSLQWYIDMGPRNRNLFSPSASKFRLAAVGCLHTAVALELAAGQARAAELTRMQGGPTTPSPPPRNEPSEQTPLPT
jgi:hypothetical protein